ncbi:MAG TPA: GNAT family N-acetyltransferase [Acidimicrobiales bacterium]|nr:GNAT family N-acetyltransferase [Acidimicrobiales bacterium]
MVTSDVNMQVRERGSGEACRRVLATLPTWFGIPESVEDYVANADGHPTVVATVDGDDVGILTLVVHTPYAAEVYVMAVRPEHHRHGLGRRMLEVAESWLRERDIEYLQVKTLSPRHPDPGYVKTREFYFAAGFRPLEEFPELWQPENPALQMIKTLAPRPPDA